MELNILKKVRKTVLEAVVDTVEVELPSENKYYKMVDDGRFFARGVVLFAITIRYKSTFLLFEIERGKQFYTDFVPTKDCRQEDFLESESDIRRTALDLMLNKNSDFTEITKDEFLKERESLLNDVLTEVL